MLANLMASSLLVLGLKRLAYTQRIAERIPFTVCLPAIGQGALGIECRANDTKLQKQLAFLDDRETHRCVESERRLSHLLGGNCRLPIAAHAYMENAEMHLRALVGDRDGQTLLTAAAHGRDPVALSEAVAQDLIKQGAKEILRQQQEA